MFFFSCLFLVSFLEYIVKEEFTYEESITETEQQLIDRTCPKCLRTYQHEQAMLSHLRYVCGKPPAFKCTFCDFKTKSKNYLKQHIARKHKKYNRTSFRLSRPDSCLKWQRLNTTSNRM